MILAILSYLLVNFVIMIVTPIFIHNILLVGFIEGFIFAMLIITGINLFKDGKTEGAKQ